MRKNIIFATIAVASTILLALSCTKQDSSRSASEARIFTASIERVLTKTALVNNVNVNWSKGDLININGTAVYSATPTGNGTAEFTFEKGEPTEASEYMALYPASLLNGEGVHFPKIQEYQSGRLNAPMFAFSNTKELKFRNMCGVVCFALTGNAKVRGIELRADYNALCGAVELNPQTAVAKIVDQLSDETNKVALDCGENGVQLDTKAPTYFFIYVPETTFKAGTLHTTIVGMEGNSLMSSTIYNNVTVERNYIYTFNMEINASDDEEGQVVERIGIGETNILPGEFTVDKNGTKVKFTSGNVVWTSKYGWESDMDPEGRIVIPFENEKDSVNLFLWHNDAEKSYLSKYNDNPSAPYLFCDGHAALFNNGETDLYVLSKEQWEYLLFSRPCDAHFARARYKGMPGLLLFPDILTSKAIELFTVCNKDEESISDIDGGDEGEGFPENSISDGNFESLVKEGFVFLPAEGCRAYIDNAVKIDGGLTNEAANGNYWALNGKGIATLEIDNNEVNLQVYDESSDPKRETFYSMALGASIRLVQVIPSVPAAQEEENQKKGK